MSGALRLILLVLTMLGVVTPAAAAYLSGASRTFAYDARGNATDNGNYGDSALNS